MQRQRNWNENEKLSLFVELLQQINKRWETVEMRQNNQPQYSNYQQGNPNRSQEQPAQQQHQGQSQEINQNNYYSHYPAPAYQNYPYPYYQYPNQMPPNMPAYQGYPNYHPPYTPYPQPPPPQMQEQYYYASPNANRERPREAYGQRMQPDAYRSPNERKFERKGERSYEKPNDPRKKHQSTPNRPSPVQRKEREGPAQRKDQQQNQHFQFQSDSQAQSSSEDEQILYQKSKTITKKRDPILDSPQEIKKWIEARRRNYPTGKPKTKNQSQSQLICNQMSILESKIRKKIMFVTSDGRGLMKKLKNMYILRRLVADPNCEYHRGRGGKGRVDEERIRRIKRAKNKCKPQIEEQPNAQTAIQTKPQKLAQQLPTLQQKQSQSNNSEAPVEQPIIKQSSKAPQQSKPIEQQQPIRNFKGGLTPQDMIAHLRQKQREDTEFYGQLLNYKTNSLNYKYSAQTLETNFVLQDIFEESSYLLQIIRYIAKNNFFQK